jgi:glycosyltransferase involved in cell wall biosynthesis
MANKKILFISYDGMTDPLGQSQVIPYLTGLTKFGYSFTILSCDKPDRYATHKDYVQKLLKPYPIQWVSIPYHKNPPVISSWYDYRMLRKVAVKLHLLEKFDLVHTRVGVPALVGFWLKKNLGIKFLNDIRGFWADERVDGGMWNIKNPIYKFVYHYFKKKEYEFIINADYNTCLTFAARSEIHSWLNIPNQPIPIEVIPCCADMDLFDPSKIDPLLKQYFKTGLNIGDDDIIISYLGSIGGWYLTEEMMRFCKLLSDKMPMAKFLFISPHLHDTIAAAAVKFGLAPGKLIVKHGNRHEIPALLSLSDYSVFFIKQCYSKMSSSPTKHGEIMAMGIPVITNDGVGDVEKVVTNFNAGYVVKDFRDHSFNIVIDKMLDGNLFNKSAIRNGAKEFYSLQNAVESYHKVYGKIFEEA